MCVLDCAQKVKSAVGGCRGKADVETHCVRYSLMKRYLIPLLVPNTRVTPCTKGIAQRAQRIRQKM